MDGPPRNGSVWSEVQKLVAPEALAGDAFGYAVALDGDTALIGAPTDNDDDNGDFSGSFYMFTRNDDVWSRQRKIVAADGTARDAFGTSLALDGDTALIGAPDDYDYGVPDNQDLDPFDPAVGEGIETTISRSVLSTADDVEQRSSGRIAFDSSDLELVNDGGFEQSVGLRFADLAIPQGAIIQEARVQFWVDEPTDESASLILRGVDSDDAGPWRSSSYNVSSRPKTNASVNWSPPPWTRRGTAPFDQTQSPDLAAVVQQILSRSGGQAGRRAMHYRW